MVFGASENEIALVAFLLVLVLLATKVDKIGERIGGLFEARAGAAGDEERPESADSREGRRDS